MTQKANTQVRKTFQTPAFRLSYPALLEARETLNSRPGAPDLKFGCTMLFPKKEVVAKLKAEKHPASTWMSDDNCAGLYQTILQVARGNFGPDVDLASLKLTKFRDGDKPKDNGKLEESAAGMVVVKTTSKDKPTLLRQDKTPITDAAELYAGCWVRAVLTAAPFLKPSHGVTIYLAGIQKLADDQAFSGRPRCEDEFDAVAAEGQGFMGGAVDTAPTSAPTAAKQPWEAK